MPLAGVILAGGRSSRMEGQDKAFATLGGRTLLARAAERLAPQVTHLVLSANGEPSRYALPGIATVADDDDSRAGPLAGILAALRWAAALPTPPQALASVAVDTPFFPRDLAERLAEAAAASGQSGTIAIAASAGAWHPTFALWPIEAADDVAAWLARGERRVRGLVASRPHVVVDFPLAGGFDPFFNVNTQADLARAETLLHEEP